MNPLSYQKVIFSLCYTSPSHMLYSCLEVICGYTEFPHGMLAVGGIADAVVLCLEL